MCVCVCLFVVVGFATKVCLCIAPHSKAVYAAETGGVQFKGVTFNVFKLLVN